MWDVQKFTKYLYHFLQDSKLTQSFSPMSNDLSTYLVPSLYCVSFLSLFFQIIIILIIIIIIQR